MEVAEIHTRWVPTNYDAEISTSNQDRWRLLYFAINDNKHAAVFDKLFCQVHKSDFTATITEEWWLKDAAVRWNFRARREVSGNLVIILSTKSWFPNHY